MTSIIASFTGHDSISALDQILSHLIHHLPQTTLVDIRHNVLRKHLALALQFHTNQQQHLHNILLSIASQLSLHLHCQFHPSSILSITNKFHPHVITILSSNIITPSIISHVSTICQKYSFTVNHLTKLSSDDLRCLELQISTQHKHVIDITNIREELFKQSKIYEGVDIIIQQDNIHRRFKKLVVFDMDSTLIQQEVIDELAKYAGVYNQVKQITHEAMNGKLDFYQSLTSRCELLKNTSSSNFDLVIKNLIYTQGIHSLCSIFKKLNYKLAVISGGFTYITKYVQQQLSLDYQYANTLEIINGKFTGNTIGPIVTARRKADLLKTIAQQENIHLNQVIAIGDGANDLPMLHTAGLGIAFNAKQTVQKKAKVRMNQSNIMNVLYLLGLTEREQNQLIDFDYHPSIHSTDSVSSLSDVPY